MANRKPPRAHNDIQALAARWRTAWSPGDGIEPWLRRHLGEMTLLIRYDRWSWNDLARALNDAGILYGTGRPWSATRLSDKACKLRARQRQAAIQPTLQGLAVAIREALTAASGGFANINISFPAAVSPSHEQPTKPARRTTEALDHTKPASETRPDDADIPADPNFAFARLKDWSAPGRNDATGDRAASASADGKQTMRSKKDVEQLLEEFVGRPRRSSIPMPPIPEPEDE